MKTTGHPEIDLLYKAVAHYVTQRGGSVAVIGGIEIMECAEDNKTVYRVAVKCTGRKPTFAEQEKA